jgi:hypothetical protein
MKTIILNRMRYDLIYRKHRVNVKVTYREEGRGGGGRSFGGGGRSGGKGGTNRGDTDERESEENELERPKRSATSMIEKSRQSKKQIRVCVPRPDCSVK